MSDADAVQKARDELLIAMAYVIADELADVGRDAEADRIRRWLNDFLDASGDPRGDPLPAPPEPAGKEGE